MPQWHSTHGDYSDDGSDKRDLDEETREIDREQSDLIDTSAGQKVKKADQCLSINDKKSKKGLHQTRQMSTQSRTTLSTTMILDQLHQRRTWMTWMKKNPMGMVISSTDYLLALVTIGVACPSFLYTQIVSDMMITFDIVFNKSESLRQSASLLPGHD